MLVLSAAHYQWATRPKSERFKSLSDLHDAAVKQRVDSAVLEAQPLSKLRVDPTTDDVTLNGLSFTNWSFGQLASRLGAPRDFLSDLSPDTCARALNEKLAKADGEAVMLVDRNRVRALTSEKYTRLWNDSVTRVLLRAKPDTFYNPKAYADGKWGAGLEDSGLYMGDRDMFAFFVDGGDAWTGGDLNRQLHRGFYVKNSEVGARFFELTSFTFDAVCCNHYIWGARNVNTVRARHTKGVVRGLDALELFLVRLADNTDDPRAAFIKAATAARERFVASFTDDLTDLEAPFRKLDFMPHEVSAAREVALQEVASPTGSAWDWYLGFTGRARMLAHPDQREAAEEKAAILLK